MRSALLVLLGVVVSGCSSVLDPKVLVGTWQQDVGGTPGNFFEMTLSSQGSSISGDGFGCGEAGPCGNATIVGNVDSRGIHLTITNVINLPAGGFTVSTSQFEGHLFTGDLMLGKLRAVGPGSEVGLVYDVRYMRGVESPILAAQSRTN